MLKLPSRIISRKAVSLKLISQVKEKDEDFLDFLQAFLILFLKDLLF